MLELRVQNQNGLHEALCSDAWNAELGRYRFRFACRDLPDEEGAGGVIRSRHDGHLNVGRWE